MNNRIMAALFALTLCLCLFIGVVPVDADAACNHAFYKATEVTSDTHHWKVCGNGFCNEIFDKEEHTLTIESTPSGHKATCSGCDYKDVGPHKPDGVVKPCYCKICKALIKHSNKTPVVKYDETEHWNACAACDEKLTGSTASHNLSYSVVVVNGVSRHEVSCSSSGCYYKVTEDHNYTDVKWQSNAAGTHHFRACSECGDDDASYGAHDYQHVDNDNGTHTATCKVCDLVNVTDDHELEKVKNADGTHSVWCKWCDFKVTNEPHLDEDKNCRCDLCGYVMHDYSAYNVKSDGKTHIKACVNCKAQDPKAVWEDHKYSEFESYANGTHKAKCSVCDHISENELRCSVADKNNDHTCDDCGGRVGHIYTSDSYMELVKKKAAKCEEVGYTVEHKKCRICGLRLNDKNQVLTDEEVIIPALDHKYVWAKAQENEHYRYCSRSGCKTEVLDRGPHTITYVPGTRADNVGRHYATCNVCGYQAATGVDCEDIPLDGKCECKCGYKLPHDIADLKTVAEVAATCTKEGNILHYTCKECNGIFSYTGGVVKPLASAVTKALGHDWAHSEDISGKHILECGNCHEKEMFDHTDDDGDCLCDIRLKSGRVCGAPLHTHSYKQKPAVAATCTTAGTEAYYYFAPCGRMFSDDTYTTEIEAPVSTGLAACAPGAWINEGDNHVKYCTVCSKVVDSAAHTDANGDNRCDVCNFELALDFVAEVPATCTTAGTKAHYISRITGRSYWDAEGTKYISDVNDLTIRAFAHVDPVTGAGPVCSDKGNGNHEYKCTLCGVVTKTEKHTTGGCFCAACGAGASADHVATTYAYQAPVCDQDGHEAYAQCSCGKYYTAAGVQTTYQKLVLKATGHTWGAEIFNDDVQGKHYGVCEICGAKNYGEHSLTVKDPLSGNYHQMICACGEVKLEEHYDNNGDNVCDDNGCKRDLSGKKVDVQEHDNKTVVTGDASNTNSAWSWLKNWLTNTPTGNAGGSTNSGLTSNPGTAPSTGDSGSTSTPPASNNPQPDASTNLMQQITSFFNWIFSSLFG